MRFFPTPNSKTIIATLRIKKFELAFLLILCFHYLLCKSIIFFLHDWNIDHLPKIIYPILLLFQSMIWCIIECIWASYHCVKSVQIRSFFCSVFSRIRTESNCIRAKHCLFQGMQKSKFLLQNFVGLNDHVFI